MVAPIPPRRTMKRPTTKAISPVTTIAMIADVTGSSENSAIPQGAWGSEIFLIFSGVTQSAAA